MGYDECDKTRRSAEFVAFPDDGAGATVCIVCAPEPVEKPGFRGKPVTRYYFPVVHEKQLKILDTSGKTYDSIRDTTKRMLPVVVRITRRGPKGSTSTWYDVVQVPMTEQQRGYATDPTVVARARAMLDEMVGRPATPAAASGQAPATQPVGDAGVEDTIPF